MNDPFDSSPEFRDAHERATMWVKLGHTDNILTDSKIPENLRDRIHRFVTGADIQPSFTLPLSSKEKWFEDPNDNSNFHHYIERLVSKEWPDTAIQSIEESTRKIMNFLFDPSEDGQFQKYGLVVGRVQSGKTANYTGLISRAVDAGYDIIIVLAGLHNNLRRQTQIRLQDEIISQHHYSTRRRLIPLTDEDDDFQTLPSAQLFNVGKDKAVLLVVKKNVSPLTKLYEQLRELDSMEILGLNLLIVDDEADHATINGKKIDQGSEEDSALKGYEEDEEEEEDEISDSTKINSRIRQILGLFTRYSYVGYTATPFANILIDPDIDHASLGPTLYPRSFILSLQKPENYGGLEEFFPSDIQFRDPDLSKQVVVIPREDAINLRELDIMNEVGKESSLPRSLIDAIMDFYISGAIRTSRELKGFNHTMLVHIKHTTSNQSPIYQRISELTKLWREMIPNIYSTEGEELRRSFQRRWEDEFSTNPSTTEEWSVVQQKLIEFTLFGVETRLVNSDKGDDLDYEKYLPNGLHVIAVGGNRLSRGLTLEGLCCTYFVRESRMYDTLTQMGRWFGFRPGYFDLVRLHITGLLVEWFTWLTSVEKSVISDIDRYSRTGKSPTDLAVRILRHRTMLPTSKNKMQHARLFSNSLSASTPRMTRFLFHSPTALRQNLRNITEFLQSLESEPEKPLPNETLLWRGVEPERVLSLVQGHKHHPDDKTFDPGMVEDYIKSRLDLNELSNWSVALISTREGNTDRPMKEFGSNIKIKLPRRTRIKGGDSIGELIQSTHVVLDLPGSVSEYMVNNQVSYPLMYRHRRPGNPLLLIYILDPIASENIPSASRVPLFSQDQEKIPVVGLAMALPVSKHEGENSERVLSEYWALGGIDHGN